MSNVRSKRDFNEKLDVALNGKKNTVVMNRERYDLIVETLQRLHRECERPRSSTEYKWMNKYYLTESNGVSKITKIGANTLLVAKEDFFDVINEAHIKQDMEGAM